MKNRIRILLNFMEKQTCPICLEETKEKVDFFHCNHKYHVECFENLIKYYRVCSICKAKIVVNEASFYICCAFFLAGFLTIISSLILWFKNLQWISVLLGFLACIFFAMVAGIAKRFKCSRMFNPSNV